MDKSKKGNSEKGTSEQMPIMKRESDNYISEKENIKKGILKNKTSGKRKHLKIDSSEKRKTEAGQFWTGTIWRTTNLEEDQSQEEQFWTENIWNMTIMKKENSEIGKSEQGNSELENGNEQFWKGQTPENQFWRGTTETRHSWKRETLNKEHIWKGNRTNNDSVK